MKPVRLGVIGCGAMGIRHAEAAAQSKVIELVAVADPVAERAAAAATQHGAPRVYTDGRALLDDPAVEAVVLALPTHIRALLAHEAFARGKHVLLEKPAAMNVAELQGLIAARGSLVAAAASSRFRLLPSVPHITAFLREADLGPIRSIFIRDFSPAGPRPEQPKPAWRLRRDLNGGGILVNWGCYDLDYVMGVLDWQLIPTQVFAQTWSIPPRLRDHVAPGSEAETHLVAFIRCAGGQVIHYERGEYVPLRTPCTGWEILGAHGALRLSMRAGDDKQIHYDSLDAQAGSQSRVIWSGAEDVQLVHQRPVQDFAEAIVDRRPPATTLEQALILQKITDAVYDSAEQGTVVNID